jgi:hypothetical protein
MDGGFVIDANLELSIRHLREQRSSSFTSSSGRWRRMALGSPILAMAVILMGIPDSLGVGC